MLLLLGFGCFALASGGCRYAVRLAEEGRKGKGREGECGMGDGDFFYSDFLVHEFYEIDFQNMLLPYVSADG